MKMRKKPNHQTWMMLSALTLAVTSQPLVAQETIQSIATQKSVLRSSAAQTALIAAEAEASRLGASVAITIVDDSGAMLREMRMDGASPIVIEYAWRKAQTSLLFGAPTAELAIDPANQPLIGQLPSLLFVSGGVAIRYQGRVIGAIGVSGSTGEVDGKIAAAGLRALEAEAL